MSTSLLLSCAIWCAQETAADLSSTKGFSFGRIGSARGYRARDGGSSSTAAALDPALSPGTARSPSSPTCLINERDLVLSERPLGSGNFGYVHKAEWTTPAGIKVPFRNILRRERWLEWIHLRWLRGVLHVNSSVFVYWLCASLSLVGRARDIAPVPNLNSAPTCGSRTMSAL